MSRPRPAGPVALRRAPGAKDRAALADDVRAGLTRAGQKRLSSRWLYDEVGSALFEAICMLPEYGVTRADTRILEKHAGEIAHLAERPSHVAELGSGTGQKTRPILAALARRRPVTYTPIDVSVAALGRCEAEMLLVRRVTVDPFEGDYLAGLAHVAAGLDAHDRLLVLFLGGTIGNFEPAEAEDFLRKVRRLLRLGDTLLLGIDLVKPVQDLLAAYDDPAGVTASFDLNLLARLNRELEAGFDLSRFVHETRWDAHAQRVEMHLRAREAVTVPIPGAGIDVAFAAGETIWTESSHKYLPDAPAEIARRTGFRVVRSWIDHEWPFAETLLRAVDD